MEARCKWCKFRSDPEIGGCKFSPGGKELPMRPNPSAICRFIELEGKSRFEVDPRFEAHGKKMLGIPNPDPAPKDGAIFTPTPQPDGKESLVVGSGFRYLTDGEHCWANDEERTYICSLEEMRKRQKAKEQESIINEILEREI